MKRLLLKLNTFTLNKNIVFIIVLNLVIALCQFITFTIINQKLGKDVLGIWSLVLAATAIGQLSGFGLSNGLVRYLPDFFFKNEIDKAEKLISTVNLSNSIFSIPLIVLLYFPIMMYAEQLLTGDQLRIFNDVIAWSLLSLFINNLFFVYSYVFDALQKHYIRCIIQISGWILFIFLTVIWVPKIGLKAVAYANVIQSVFQLLLIRISVYRTKLFKRIVFWEFDKRSFKLIFAFGAKLQLINILVIFFDPLIKFFITRYAGLSTTANYELANKMTIQARNLLVNANQTIIPQIVLHKSLGSFVSYFSEIKERNLMLSTLIGLAVLFLSPFAILIFAGQFDRLLFQGVILLNIASVSNMITSIYYFACMGTDKLNKLVILHFLYPFIAIIAFFILPQNNMNTIIAIAIPAFSTLIGSIYNSSVLSEIAMPINWLWSDMFLFFVFISVIMLFIPITSFIVMIIIAIFSALGFLILFRNKLKYLFIKKI